MVTDNQEIYDRAVAFGHYDRYTKEIATDPLKPYAGLPLGGIKGRVNQLSAAMGRVQLKYYDERCAEIDKAMNYFWDQLKDVPGIRAHRVDKSDGSTMGGWYCTLGQYVAEELGGLSLSRFCKAVAAEGVSGVSPGCNAPLHLHPVFNDCDIYHDGKPTRIAFSDRDLRQPAGSLPVTEAVNSRVYHVPWFKKYRTEQIDEYVKAFRKVAENYKELLAEDTSEEVKGSTGLTARNETRKETQKVTA
jgi:dTDP-4-amino-4,6-dideoxygalactose transaminase